MDSIPWEKAQLAAEEKPLRLIKKRHLDYIKTMRMGI